METKYWPLGVGLIFVIASCGLWFDPEEPSQSADGIPVTDGGTDIGGTDDASGGNDTSGEPGGDVCLQGNEGDTYTLNLNFDSEDALTTRLSLLNTNIEDWILRPSSVNPFGEGHLCCGQSLHIRNDPDDIDNDKDVQYAVIPSSSAWKTTQGSVSFWVKLSAFDPDVNNGRQGLISRDAFGTDNAGHFSIWADGRTVVLRLQDTQNEVHLRAFDALTANRWYHIGANFGGDEGLELYIDGKLEEKDVTAKWGIDGNNNPWAIGATIKHSNEGSAQGADLYSLDALFDDVQISNQRRNFDYIQKVLTLADEQDNACR